MVAGYAADNRRISWLCREAAAFAGRRNYKIGTGNDKERLIRAIKWRTPNARLIIPRISPLWAIKPGVSMMPV